MLCSPNKSSIVSENRLTCSLERCSCNEVKEPGVHLNFHGAYMAPKAMHLFTA